MPETTTLSCSEFSQRAGTSVVDCYQCGKCSGGCPMARRMDLLPNQLLRLAQLGQWERVTRSSAIWLCVSCQLCTARCPQHVDCAGVLDALRQMAIEHNVAAPSQHSTWSFQQAFLSNIRRNGRLNELELVGMFKSQVFASDWKLSGLFKDSLMAPRLMRRGKFHWSGERVRDRGVVRRIFQRCQADPAVAGEGGAT